MVRNRTDVCSHKLLHRFGDSMDRKMWRVTVLMLFNAVLMLVVVAIAAYAPRYRRHPLIRFLFLGASTLFLPIVSDVAATLGGDQYFSGALFGRQVVAAKCQPGIHVVLVLLWTGLVVLIGINTSAVVAADAREGRNIEPPTELLIKAIWTAYLMYITTTKKGFFTTTRYLRRILRSGSLDKQVHIMFALLTFLTILKLLFKYIRFYKAKRSVALARSPRLIVGYMAQLIPLPERSQGADQQPPPALIVQGEETGKVQKRSSGYFFEGTPEPDQQGDAGTTRKAYPQLVTLDRVWGLADNKLPAGSKRPKDLCFSFALFKLLRCRFAKYTVWEAGFMKVHRFFWATLLEGNDDYERIFRVVADELSFIHDYYYSTPPSNVILSLFSISCCVYMLVFISRAFHYLGGYEQIYCKVWCPGKSNHRRQAGDRSLYSIGHGNNKIGTYLDFGNTYYDVVPVYLVIAVLVISEIRDIVSRIGSKWSKVALVCKYAKDAASPERSSSTCLQKRIAFVFRYCRVKMVKSWEGKMNQSSILVLHRWRISLLPRRLLGLPNQNKTKVPSQVKEAIFQALQQENLTSEREGGLKFSTSTPPLGSPATRSRYCAYLVIYLPGLLPDDDEWCESLHKDVKKDADRVLASRHGSGASTPEAEYQQLVNLLGADSNHEVLKNGARIGKQLENLETDQWGALATFWSEMILYVAPSENLDGHAEAIACGGELITLIWVLLEHAGIVGREDAVATYP